MKCSDVQRVLPEVLDGAPDGAFPTDFDATNFDMHVKSCPDCSDLVSDLKLISSEARQLAADEEPPARVWVRIAAELRAEGLIREQDVPLSASSRPILVPSPSRRRWSAWWLAPVAAAVLAASSYVVRHKQAPVVSAVVAPVVAQQVPATQATATVPASAPETTKTTVTAATKPDSVLARAPQSAKPVAVADAADDLADDSSASASLEAGSPAEDQQFLRAVSTLAPSMRATYESQLKAVNDDIRESQAYLDRNPGDADAREHLMDAYQQKALLYQIGLDRIQ
jgi:hypothetical protein